MPACQGADLRVYVELVGRYSNRTDWAKQVGKLPEMTALSRPAARRKSYSTVRKLSPEQVQELVAAHRAGATMRELATRYQIHRETVSLHLLRQGVRVRRAKPTW